MAQMEASEAVFRVLGMPGSRVYNFANANRTNSGEFNQQAVIDTFAESLEESLRRSDASIERLSSGS